MRFPFPFARRFSCEFSKIFQGVLRGLLIPGPSIDHEAPNLELVRVRAVEDINRLPVDELGVTFASPVKTSSTPGHLLEHLLLSKQRRMATEAPVVTSLRQTEAGVWQPRSSWETRGPQWPAFVPPSSADLNVKEMLNLWVKNHKLAASENARSVPGLLDYVPPSAATATPADGGGGYGNRLSQLLTSPPLFSPPPGQFLPSLSSPGFNGSPSSSSGGHCVDVPAPFQSPDLSYLSSAAHG
jgi:hypothetical protein